MMPRMLAIIPAAGRSRRMGQPKLLLDVAGQTVIARVITALQHAGVARCLVVIRSSDSQLIQEARRAGAEVVLPSVDPEEMRQSVEYALRFLQTASGDLPAETAAGFTTPCDGWLLIPADHPTLNPLLVQQLIAAWSASPEKIAVPTFEGHRGHPTIFPWGLVDEVLALPADQGLNQVLRANPDRVLEVDMTDSQILDDLDTPDDFKRLLQRFKTGRAESAE